jgi:hypothetical protein
LHFDLAMHCRDVFKTMHKPMVSEVPPENVFRFYEEGQMYIDLANAGKYSMRRTMQAFSTFSLFS